MRGRPYRSPALFAGLALALALAVLIALSVGALAIPFPAVLGWLGLPAAGTEPAPHEAAALLQLRLPRIVLGLLVGGALAMAGAAMQGLVRNPLADPGLIGISSGAALCACAVMVLGVSIGLAPAFAAQWLLPAGAFAGAALATLLALRLARAEGYTRMTTLLLAGLAINAVAGAGIGFLAQLADEQALRSITFWMFGSLGRSGWPEITVAAILLALPLVLLPRLATPLNALLLGEAEAGHLGVDIERLKRQVMWLVVLAVGTAVAVAGIIGFVGLIVPHILRLVCGPDHRPLLPASALGGALLLVLADTAARTWFAPSELPIGILTALLGGPFFLALLVRYRDRPELG